jgi:hypothetical protein
MHRVNHFQISFFFFHPFISHYLHPRSYQQFAVQVKVRHHCQQAAGFLKQTQCFMGGGGTLWVPAEAG